MSTRGKLYRRLENLMVEQGELNVRINKLGDKLDKLPDEDQLWVLKKILKSPAFNDLPGELTQEARQMLSNIDTRLNKKTKEKIPTITEDFIDDLPF